MSVSPSSSSALARLIARAILPFFFLGDRRDDVEADVLELFERRRRQRGAMHAYARLIGDLASVARPRRSRSTTPPVIPRLSASMMDLRYGLRLFRKHPAVIGGTITGLALAMAVGTTVFTIVNAGVMRPYGMADPHSVVNVHMYAGDGGSMSTQWPYHAFIDLRDRASHARVEAFLRDGARLSTSSSDMPTRVDALLLVSGGYLPTLGAHAVLGRTLQPSDDAPGAPAVVVLNYGIWTSRLARDPQIVGKTIWLSGTPVTVVGVIESSFTGPVDNPPAFWVPFGSYAEVFRDRPLERTSDLSVSVIARVDPGVDRAAATSELSAIASSLDGLRVQSGRAQQNSSVVVRLEGAASPMDGPDAANMWALVGAMFGIVGLIVALACANVANLLLASAATRAREIGVRLALGASRGRILRQLLSESVVIGVVAGAGALVLSLWLVPIVARATGLPDTIDLRPDRMVLLFTAGIALVSGLGAGVAPARHASRNDLIGVIKSDGVQVGAPPKATRTRRWFIGFQAAVSMLLLVAAGLFLRAALRITHIDIGFEPDRLAAVSLGVPRNDHRTESEAFWQDALDRIRAVPSVENASLVMYPPFGGAIEMMQFNRGSGIYQINKNATDAAYFDTAGFRIVRGRGYTADEVRQNAPVAVVSESLVRDFLGGTEPIGASLEPISESLKDVHIVGVVAEAVTRRVQYQGNGTIYRPLAAKDLPFAQIVIRTRTPEAVLRPVEQAIKTIDPDIRPVTTLVSDAVARHMNEPRILAGLSASIALLALTLAVLGLYGVTTFVVRQRMWELHIRQAIGATASDIVRLLVRQSLSPVVIGLTIGLAIALAAAGVLTPVLSGLSPYDPAAIGGAVAVLLAAATAAVISPAIRASRADAAAGLRQI